MPPPGRPPALRDKCRQPVNPQRELKIVCVQCVFFEIEAQPEKRLQVLRKEIDSTGIRSPRGRFAGSENRSLPRPDDHLLAEGFVTGQAGAGTFVSAGMSRNVAPGTHGVARMQLSRFGKVVSESIAMVNTPLPRPKAPRYNFIYGRSDLTTFPFAVWRRLLARQAREGSTKQFDYGSALGNAELRAAICAHLRRSRAVMCEPEEVIIVNGSQQALDLVIRVLVDPGDTVALEDPHYDGIRGALRAAGARLRGVPVDREGLDPARLPDDARLVLVTPSHHVSNRRDPFAGAKAGAARLGAARKRRDHRRRLRWRVPLCRPSCGIAAGPRPRRAHRVHRNVLANGLSLHAHRLRHRAKVAGSGTHRGKMGERSALGIARAANPSELHRGRHV